MFVLRQIIIISIALLFQLSRAHTACYYPSGDLAAQDVACDSTESISHCCSPGSICLSNKLCTKGGEAYERGSCTDQSWDSPDCPKFCLDPAVDVVKGPSTVKKCPGNGEDRFYCGNKNEGKADCVSEVGIMTSGSPLPLTTIEVATKIYSSTSSSTTTHSAPGDPFSPQASSSTDKGIEALETGARIVLLAITAALLFYMWRGKKTRESKEKLHCSPTPTKYEHRTASQRQDEDEVPSSLVGPNGRVYVLT